MSKSPRDDKKKQLENFYKKNTGKDKKLTSDTGYKLSNDERSLRAGKRGPTLLQDTNFYRKQSRINRERIPEKVVHARGFGLYGEFELYKSLKNYTVANFLQTPGSKTDVFCRFSNFIGSKGSKDTAVDIRGFAVKFYTKEGNYDMLSLQFPCFIISDAMKFADVTHAVKPNPKTDVPQASVADERFWDYVANNKESAHMVMWLMSMRGRPRSWRMMEGYPINTFILVNEHRQPTFVRFVWKPKLGVHSLLLDEANILGGIDPDFHRQDIIEAVKKKVYPEYELGVQLIPFEDQFKYEFDVLDATKLWPVEEVPVEVIGKMTLNRLVENFFAEDEQSSFDPATLVPGIQFSNDPVLQGRAFAYRDTDYHRLGTGNIDEIPVNKPISEVNNNFRDSYSKYYIDIDEITYKNNSLAQNTPKVSSFSEGGYEEFPLKVEGNITRDIPSDSFIDYYRQARLFWNSLAKVEKQDLIKTFIYHLQNVPSKSVRQENVNMWANVDYDFAVTIAEEIGVEKPKYKTNPNTKSSAAISQLNTPHLAASQKVAILIADNYQNNEVKKVLKKFEENKVFYDIVSDRLGELTSNTGEKIKVTATFITKNPALYDSIYVVGGKAKNEEAFKQHLIEYIKSAYKHYKPIGLSVYTSNLISRNSGNNLAGVVFAENNPNFARDLVWAIAKQRFWDRR